MPLRQARVGLGGVLVDRGKRPDRNVIWFKSVITRLNHYKKVTTRWKTGKTMHFLNLIIHNVLDDQEENIYCKSHNIGD